MNLRFWKVVATAAVLAGMMTLADVPTAEAGGRLVVKRFLLGRLEPNTNKFVATGARGTTNAYRDNVVMFVFSQPVNFDSVDNRTIKIGIPSGQAGELFIDADGEFYRYVLKKFDNVSQTFIQQREYRNRVIFDPTSRQAANPTDVNPFGFSENTTYRVTVPGLDAGTTKVVKSRKGEFNEETFETTFRTTSSYLQDYSQPAIVAIEASDAPGIPLADRDEVDSRADIVAYFSEPMLPGSFDPDSTFIVRMLDDDTTDGLPFTPRPLSGTIRQSPDGLSFSFRPAFGYGRGPASIEVELTGDLTDRSANVVTKGAVIAFTSELDPLAPNFNELTEEFTDNVYEDTTYQATYVLGDWNVQKNPGVLAGIFGNLVTTIITASNSGNAIPWWYTQAHSQHLYSATSSEIGTTPRTISGFMWRYYYGTAAASASYSAITIQMGHNTSGSLASTWASSYSDTPVTTYPKGTYNIPTSDVDWITGPKFTTNFSFNGKDNVVLEIDNPNGCSPTVYNYWRHTSNSGGTTHVRQYSGTGTIYLLTWKFDTKFFYLVDRSEAQSHWYDTGVLTPNWLDPIIVQSIPPGTSALITFQGAHEDGQNPGTPDETGVTAWTTDPVSDLRGFRFIRFHADMTSNIGAQTKPIIESIKLPFIYY
jgi:hypothetical protein